MSLATIVGAASSATNISFSTLKHHSLKPNSTAALPTSKVQRKTSFRGLAIEDAKWGLSKSLIAKGNVNVSAFSIGGGGRRRRRKIDLQIKATAAINTRIEEAMADGPKLEIFDLTNGTITVKVSNYGCTILSLFVPDNNGKADDVVLGFDSLKPYLQGHAPYFGCIVGRVANRIKDGKFALDGVQYSLPINKPPNSLHGGRKGYDKVIWEVVDRKDGDIPSITYKYYSQDGEEGYPGDLTVTATYSLPTKTSLRLDMEAVPGNKATPVSLAQHTYWNLGGHNSGDVLNHVIKLGASHVTPVDENTIPTGEIMPVKGTAFDFTTEKRIGTSIHEVGLGYDHNYVLDSGEEKSGLKHVATVKEPTSGRVMNLWSNAPGVQFYTGNYVNQITGKGGATYGKHAGVCLETQGFPNAINQPNFPSVVVKPGETYKHTMLYEFSVAE